MIDFEQIQRLLAEKKQLMLSFEESTEEMLFCPFEQLQPLVLQREEKMLQMQALDAKIKGCVVAKMVRWYLPQQKMTATGLLCLRSCSKFTMRACRSKPLSFV